MDTETGNQARTVRRLVERMGAVLVGVTVLVDDIDDEVRTDLKVRFLLLSAELL